MAEYIAVRGAGVAIAVAGAAACLYWRHYWRTSYRGVLLTGGPYGVVRHPLYSGFLLLVLGLTLALPVYETRFLLVMSLAAVAVYVPREEEALLARYKHRYREYMERVRYRLVPGVY